MWRRVSVVGTGVWEKRDASFFRVQKIRERRKVLDVSYCLLSALYILIYFSNCVYSWDCTVQDVSKIALQWYRSWCWTADSLHAFKCKCFPNSRHTVTFGIRLSSSFWKTLHSQWKSHSTETSPDRTWCILLHHYSSNTVQVLWINLYKRSKL
jgi:hypothetical protein